MYISLFSRSSDLGQHFWRKGSLNTKKWGLAGTLKGAAATDWVISCGTATYSLSYRPEPS